MRTELQVSAYLLQIDKTGRFELYRDEYLIIGMENTG